MKIFPSVLLVSVLALKCLPNLWADDDLYPKPVMITATGGWWQKVEKGKSETLHTADSGKTWRDVTPEGVSRALQQQEDLSADVLSDLVCLEPLDERKLWLAVPLFKENQTIVAYTADEGLHWWQGTAPIIDDGISLSFLDERQGFLLATSRPAFGHMDKHLLGTTDGGRHWQKLSVPKEGGYYVSGFCFRTPQEGWIGGQYRGLDGIPLFRTDDGGQTWTRQSLPIPEMFAKHENYYANATVPNFSGPDRQHGTLGVSFHQHVDVPYFDAEAEYHSDDGGRTWQLPADGVKALPKD